MFAVKFHHKVQILMLILTASSKPSIRRTNDEILNDFIILDPASPTFDLDFLGVLIYEPLNQTIQETTSSTIPSTGLHQAVEDMNIQETERIEIL